MATVRAFMDPYLPESLLFARHGATMKLLYGAFTDNETYTKQPPWKGVGYIGGDAPDGLVTFNGAPAVRTLDLWDRAGHMRVATTKSAADGTYRFDGLNLAREFDVRARGASASENDLIVTRIRPTIAQLVIAGTFTETASVGYLYSSAVQVSGGNGVYRNPRVTSGTLPNGLTLLLTGANLALSGTVSGLPGTVTFTVAVDSGDGQTVTKTMSILVGAKPVFSAAVLKTSPRAYYPLSEAPGALNATDYSGNGYHGTYVGQVTLGGPSLLASGYGKSISVTGGGRVQIPGAVAAALNKPFTLMAVVSTANISGTTVIFSGGGAAPQLAIAAPGQLMLGSAGMYNLTASTLALALNTPAIVFAVCDGAGNYTYYFGNNVAGAFNTTQSFGSNSANGYLLAYQDGSSYGYQGAVSDIAVWNRALSAAEIAEIVASSTP